MLRKIVISTLSVSFYILGISFSSYGQEPVQSTTTVQQSSTQVQTTPVRKKSKRVIQPSSTTTSTSSTTTVTEVKPPPPVARKVMDEETLKKMSETLCTKGFKAYVGTDKKNLCLGKASPPDIAYSCVWEKKGTPVYAPTLSGPCSLDFVEHRGNVSLKDLTAECCYRAAKGPAAAVSP